MNVPALPARLFPGRRWVVVYALSCVLLLVTIGGRSIFLHSIGSSWHTLQKEVDSTLAVDIARRFETTLVRLQTEATRLLSTVDTAAISAGSPASHARLIESLLQPGQSSDFIIEIRNNRGGLAAYTGRPLNLRARDLPFNRDTVLLRPVGPYMFLIVHRIMRGGMRETVGTIDVAGVLSTTIPNSNRFADADSFVKDIERELGIDVNITPGAMSSFSLDGRYVTIPLSAKTGQVATASVLHTDPAAYRGKVARHFDLLSGFIGSVLLALSLLHGFILLRNRRSSLLATLLFIVWLWAVRAALLFLDLESIVLPEETLNPMYFASSFAFGLTRSIAGTMLTLITLCASLLMLLRLRFDRPGTHSVHLARIAGFVFMASAPLLLRGYLASLRSFVFDSSFNFDDIQSIFDRPMFWLILGNVFFLACALVCFLTIVFRITRSARSGPGRNTGTVLIPLVGAMIGVILFRFTTEEFLIPLSGYVVLIGCYLCFVFLLPDRLVQSPLRASFLLFICVWLLSTLSASAWIAGFSDEKRRSEIESISEEIVQPTDIWSRVLVEESLIQMHAVTSDRGAETDTSDDAEVRQAFSLWSESPLCRQSVNTALILSDPAGRVLSRFAVGIPPRVMHGPLVDSCLAMPDDSVREVSGLPEIGQRQYYSGSTLLGTGQTKMRCTVILEARDRTLPPQANTDILRNIPSRESLAPEDRLALCRYEDNRLVYASDPLIPKMHSLPPEVRKTLDETHRGTWGAIEGPGRRDAYFIPTQAGNASSVSCIAIGASDIFFRVYRAVRYALVFGALSLLGFGLTQVFRIRFLRRQRFSFKTILQVSFIAVAAIPVLLIWASAKTVVSENNRRFIEQQLRESVNSLHSGIVSLVSRPDSSRFAAEIDDNTCFRIASMTGKELTVYDGPILRASNRPELYLTGLLNPRLDPRAFASLAVLQQDFVTTEEHIGDFSYFVGSGAIRDDKGNLLAIISTPTLYEQWRIEEEYIRASAIIFLGTALVLVLVFLLSRAVAAQIARPVKAFTEATKDVAAGNFDRRVDTQGPMEMERLRDSFNIMTAQVQKSRRELAAAERELAWREMAKQVAHEIRNPLTPIKLAAQHLRRAYEDRVPEFDAILRKVTDTIIEQISTLSRISDEFSRFARMPKRSPIRVSVDEALTEAVHLFQHHEAITFSVAAPDVLPPILADREELLRVFINIIKNAAQAMHDEGTITIETAIRDTAIIVTIADTGMGIPPEMLPRVFEPNFSTRTEGMGLGLAIAKKIIDDMDGRISVESSVGSGTSIIITLPVAT